MMVSSVRKAAPSLQQKDPLERQTSSLRVIVSYKIDSLQTQTTEIKEKVS